MSFVKVYFGDRPLWISNEKMHLPKKDIKIVHEDSDIKEAMSGRGFREAILISDDVAATMKRVFSKFRVAIAGGGLVKSNTGSILLIFRRNRWDLPKGHLDEGETIEECALREVMEETGLHQLKIVKPAMISYHVYRLNEEDILKETHWFLMEYEGHENLIPQTEEDIEKAEWVKPSEFESYYPKMFPLIKDVLENSSS